jgi:hypothetical protein
VESKKIQLIEKRSGNVHTGDWGIKKLGDVGYIVKSNS